MFSLGPFDPSSHIRAMTTAVRHRGPDDEGFAFVTGAPAQTVFATGPDTPTGPDVASLEYHPGHRPDPALSHPVTAALGHRRLSIVDPSPAGHQPMSILGGRYVVSYNGEIYNHPELRDELRALGARFVSETDTEVLLWAYHHWGSRCLDRFNGMFAFVLVDQARGEVLVARDRFGIKPIYSWRSPAGFLAFASEIKQFSTLPGWRAQLNAARAGDFLRSAQSDHTGETLFAGVEQLRGGERWTFALDRPQACARSRWYTLEPGTFRGDLVEAGERFRELLVDSIRLRLRADVPVGTSFSGGLDSSSIVCAVNLLLQEAGATGLQKTFSACSPHPEFDERAFMEAVVAETRVDAHYRDIVPDELFANLDRLIWHQDEPFHSTSIYAEWNVFELAGAHVRVTLDGHGADEQLAGYRAFFGPRLADLLHGLRCGALAAEVQGLRAHHGLHLTQQAAALAQGLGLAPQVDAIRGWMGRTTPESQWLNLDVPEGPSLPAVSGLDRVRTLANQQLLTTSLPVQLHWCDRDSMAHSVESRAPFLDVRLVELVASLPSDMLIDAGVTKRVLRQGLRGLLPEKIRTRMSKLGFATAEPQWIRGDRAKFAQAMDRSIDSAQGILRPGARDVLQDMVQGRTPFSFLPWRLICFGAWMDRFDVDYHP